MSTENQASNLPATINADSTGLLKPMNLNDAWRMAQYYAASGLLPDRYKSPEMVLTATQFALELGLKPLSALRQIAVVKGTPTVFGDLPLSMCLASGKMEWIKEKYFDKDSKEISMENKNLSAQVYAATCIVKRRGDPEPLEAFFTMSDAERAGLTKINGPWITYPKRMLRYRARSQALKDKFPDCLNGISIAEYDHNTTYEHEMQNVSQPNPSPGFSAPTSSTPNYGEESSTPHKETLAEKLKKKVESASLIIEAETV